MKLFSTTLMAYGSLVASLVGGVAGQGPLRALSSSTPVTTTNIGYVGITVSLENVAAGGGGSGDDEAVISSLVAAYNDIHQDSGYSLNSVFKVKEVDVPDGEGLYSVGWYKGSWESSKNLPDGSNVLPPTSLALDAEANPTVHQKFVEEFCNRLRDSGHQEFVSIKSCAVDFTYTFEVSDPVTATKTNDNNSNNAEFWPWNKPKPQPLKNVPFRAEMDLTHIDGGYSKDKGSMETDVSQLEKAFLEAYNEIHGDSDWTIENIGLERLIEYPEDDDQEDEDEDQGGPKLGYNKKYHGSGGWYGGGSICRRCAPDDDSMLSSSPLFGMLKDDRHDAFEGLVLHKLRTCGLDKYKKVRDVRIRFIYSDNDGPAQKQE